MSSRATSTNSRKQQHLRSTSLPTPSHPLLSHLSLSLTSLHSWSSSSSSSSTIDGLHLIHHLLSSLTQLLLLPSTTALPSSTLHRSLLLVDAYGSLRHSLASLRQLLAQSQVALRTHNPQALSSATAHVRCVLRDVAKLSSKAVPGGADVGLVGECLDAVLSASGAVFDGLVRFCGEKVCGSTSRWRWRRRREVVVGMEGLRSAEECVVEVEEWSEKVFRELMRNRVVLLNILTP